MVSVVQGVAPPFPPSGESYGNLIEQGKKLLEEKKGLEAELVFNKAMALLNLIESTSKIETAEIDYFLGIACFYQKRYEDARQHLKQATEHLRDPYILKDAYWLSGSCSMILKKFQEAEKSFQAALKLDPSHVSSLQSLGQIYLESKALQEAKVKLIVALSLQQYAGAPSSETVPTWFYLGKAHQGLKNTGLARHCFEAVIQKSREQKGFKELAQKNLQTL